MRLYCVHCEQQTKVEAIWFVGLVCSLCKALYKPRQ